MSVLVVAQLRFSDIARYRRYQAAFPAVFAGSGGRAIAADEAPQTLQGDWHPDKMVILEFGTEQQARRFLDSPAYRRIAQDREAGADTRSVMIRTLAAAPPSETA